MAITATRNFETLSRAPSVTEQEKSVRTHTIIREHLESDESLRKYSIQTFLQGSYKNSTNVRGDSDIDIGGLTEGIFYYDTSNLPADPADSTYFHGNRSLREQTESAIGGPASYTFFDYRRDVFKSLQSKFGESNIVDGNKAITIYGNTYRLNADVLACTDFRQYYQDYMGSAAYHRGIVFFTKSYDEIVNFPHQHFQNLGEKDRECNGKVKGVIRILKRIRNEMEERGEWDRKRSPSFYLESLVWNVPGQNFAGGYDGVVQNVLAYLWNDLRDCKSKGDFSKYMQANRIFYLFHSKFWNADDALTFIDKVWQAVFSS